MTHLLHLPYDTTLTERKAREREYRAYVQADRKRVPPRAFEFATAEWHYNHEDHRCPHDAWVESLSILEPASGDRHENRGLEIRLQLLGPYHDGRIEITYPGVRRYSLFQPYPHDRKQPTPAIPQGDWLVDEVSASDNGRPEQWLAVHEIVFANQGVWTIEAEDIIVEWKGDNA